MQHPKTPIALPSPKTAKYDHCTKCGPALPLAHQFPYPVNAFKFIVFLTLIVVPLLVPVFRSSARAGCCRRLLPLAARQPPAARRPPAARLPPAGCCGRLAAGLGPMGLTGLMAP